MHTLQHGAGKVVVKERIRPGGRSARIQASVHEAVDALLLEMERAEITIPLVAERAGVTPSTIYRRWGGLSELLSDVAVKRLRPATEPTDTGAMKSDLLAWAEQYLDEMSSELGRCMIRDVIGSDAEGNAGRCCAYAYEQLQAISDRARARGESGFDVDRVLDLVVAPIMYRILFLTPPDAAHCRALVDRALG